MAPARWFDSVSTLPQGVGRQRPVVARSHPFVTYTTRYNRDYWISVDGLDKHYERADVDAQTQRRRRRLRDQDAQT
jgi:hypothetical protein